MSANDQGMVGVMRVAWVSLDRRRDTGILEALLSVVLLALGLLVIADGAAAALPDSRGFELVSPVVKHGVSPYGAVPSTDGGTVNFQARGAFADAESGSLSLYQASRGASGWQTVTLTPTPPNPLDPLEEQAPVWFSSDLSSTIFTTPESYASGDEDAGALSLYERNTVGELTWVSRGSRGGGEPREATFDGATPNGQNVVFSSAAALLPAAVGLDPESAPEAEFLYQRDVAGEDTSLLSLDSAGRPAGAAATTLTAEYAPGTGRISVARAEGFFPGEFITVGEGVEAEPVQITHIPFTGGPNETFVVGSGGAGLSKAFPAGTQVTHTAEGSILGDGGHLTSGLPPAGEYLPANAESGSTTNAISNDGSKVFFESPNPAGGKPVGLYMRKDNTTSVKIAGAVPDGTSIAQFFSEEETTFGSARYEGAAANGSLAFFKSDEGLVGATKGQELYELNATSQEIGADPPGAVHAISAGLGGDRTPATTIAGGIGNGSQTISVASTEGFHAGETVEFAPFLVAGGKHQGGLTMVIASVDNATEMTMTFPVHGGSVPEGTELHAVHPAWMTAISSDGSRVYFISSGILAANANSEGATAAPVEPNLYVYDTATDATTFVATVAASDVQKAQGSPTGLAGEPDISRPAIPTPDGGVLAFTSVGNLTGQNPWQEYAEVYRYTVAGNKLECLSCTAPGVKPTGNANFGETAGGTYDPPGLTSPMSEDGSRVFFDTPDSLVSEDTNGSAPQSAKFGTPTSTDVYEAEGGKVYLLSSGKATTPTVLQGTTPSGDDVLFTTTAVLAAQDTDGGYENVWDARVGGGFPAEAGGGKPSCVGASCRAAFGVAPVSAPPASTTPQSPGVSAPAKAGVVAPKKALLSLLQKRLAKSLKVCGAKKPVSVRARCEAKVRRAFKKAVKASKAQKSAKHGE